MEDNTIAVIVEGSVGNLNGAMNEAGASVDKFDSQLAAMRAHIDELNARLASLEARLGKTKTATNEAVATQALFGEMTGIKIPRHLRSMIAGLEGIGPALNAAFTAVAVVALIEVFVRLLELIPKAADAFYGLNDVIRAGAKAAGADSDALMDMKRNLDDAKINTLKVGVGQLTKAWLEHKQAVQHLEDTTEKLKSYSAALLMAQKMVNQPGAKGAIMRHLPNLFNPEEFKDAQKAVNDFQTKIEMTGKQVLIDQQNIQMKLKEIAELGLQDDANLLKHKVQMTKEGSLDRQIAENSLMIFLKKKYGENSEEYKQELRKQDLEHKRFTETVQHREEASEQEAIKAREERSLMVIEIDKQQLSMLENLGLVHGQKMLAQEMRLVDKEYDVRVGGLKKQIAAELEALKKDPTRDPMALQKLLQQLYMIEMQYEQKRAELQRKFTEQRVKSFQQHFQVFRDAFKSSLTDMITGYTTFSEALQNIGKAILDDFIGMLADMLTEWIMSLLTRLIFSKLIDTTAGSGQIAVAAATGYANAYASICAIPIVGPGLAPGVATASAAAIKAAQGMLHFERGGIVPYDTLAMVHRNEMVLPANIAQQFMGGGKGGGMNVNFNVSAMDARSVDRVLKTNARSVVKMLKHQYRNGAF